MSASSTAAAAPFAAPSRRRRSRTGNFPRADCRHGGGTRQRRPYTPPRGWGAGRSESPSGPPGFRGDFSWKNQSPRSELASRGKKGMFFRESIADRLSPAHRGRGFSLQPKSFSISKQPRFAVGVGTLHLDFPSRMYLPRFGGAFLVWQRNQSPRPELLWCGSLFRECVLYPLMSASPLTPSQGRGFSCNMTANDNQISQEIQNWDPVCGG
jgi:hypothetical protein